MKQALFIGAIASVFTLNAFATSSTVTSKDYVDAQDALKQNKIPVTGTNSATPGDTVVTYTSTAGTIGERRICSAGLYGDGDCRRNYLMTVDVLDETRPIGTAGTVPVYNNDGELGSAERGIFDGSDAYNSSTDADKLVTAAALQSATNNVVENLPETTVTYKTCYEWSGTPHTDANCILWNLSDTSVYGRCTRNSDCNYLTCLPGEMGICNGRVCQCDEPPSY